VLTATAGSLTVADSNAIAISVGAAVKLAFVTQPAGAIANTAFATQPVVEIQDAGGNRVTSSTLTITLSRKTGTGTLTATALSVAAVNGVATFAGATFDTAGNFTLSATSGALTEAVSNSFTVTGPPALLEFTTQPAGATSQVAFTTQPVVEVRDSAGARVTAATGTVTLAIDNPSGAYDSGLPAEGKTQIPATCGDTQDVYIIPVAADGTAGTPTKITITVDA
jgi:hypothetical protein